MPVERADIGSHGSPGEAKVTPAGRVAEYFYRYLYFIVPLTILLQGCVSHIALPGLYMDAVNPDYMIVRLLNWNSHIYTLALPGTCLFGIFPTIIQMYHGALPYYLGAPVYMLFGTGIVGVRVANFVFASIVLMSAAVFLRVFGVRPLFIASTLAVVALDPGFLFSFRTQFYITLLPIAFVLLSVSIVENADCIFPVRRPAWRACSLDSRSMDISSICFWSQLRPSTCGGDCGRTRREGSFLYIGSRALRLGSRRI